MLNFFILFLAILFIGCGGDSKNSDATNDSKDNNFTIIRGTVPGTLIEAICENNKYFATNSVQNGTSQHPFELQIEAGLSCKMQMTTNEGTSQNIITHISFEENNATGETFKAIAHNINIGYIDLPLDKNTIQDVNNDSIVDTSYLLTIVQYVDVLDVDNSGSIAAQNYEQYDINKSYVYLDRVNYNGEAFEAKEATQGDIPDYSANGKWRPLSYVSNLNIYENYDNTKQYHYPNRVQYFNVVYEAKYDTIGEAPTDLNTSHWNRLGE